MTGTAVQRQVRRPVRNIAVIMLAVIAVPAPGVAQLPTLQQTAPRVRQAAPRVRQAAPRVRQTSQASPEDAYRLGAGDRIRLDILNVPEYSGEYQVLVDGTLNLPIIGGVPVEGLTLQQATAVISGKYARFVRRPVATVSLLAARPLKIAVSGEVNRPGSYTVTLEDGKQFPTVTQAVQLAGGITQTANVRQVEIRRRVSRSQQQTINVDLMALAKAGDLNQDISLRDGDTIYIPTNPQVDPAESRQLTTATFAPQTTQPLKVAIVGEVYRPGSYTVPPDNSSTNNISISTTTGSTGTSNKPPTVTRALEVAGGIKPSADIRRIQVRRPTKTGAEQLLDVNLWQLLREGDINQDVILQEGDTIVVPVANALDPAEAQELAAASFSPGTIKVNVVGEVKSAGTVEVPPNTPMNQAILAAGGFNTRARKRSVDLIRINPNGTVSKRRVEVDFAENINEQNNPPLRNNDVIVVRRSGLASVTDTLGTVVSPVGQFFTLFNFLRIFR